jgi:cytochrome c
MGGTWTFDALSKWLNNPRNDVPGTLMTFGGVPSEKQRANIIAYLNSNSDSPQPLPQAAQAAPAPAPAPANPPPAASAPPPADAAPPATNSPPAGQSSEQK